MALKDKVNRMRNDLTDLRSYLSEVIGVHPEMAHHLEHLDGYFTTGIRDMFLIMDAIIREEEDNGV
jgi:hypothetical protein